MSYNFKYRRKFFWNKLKVIGHQYNVEQDKMVVYFPSGAVRELAKWKDCEVHLGTDWVLETKNKMEKESGQNIKLNVDTNA